MIFVGVCCCPVFVPRYLEEVIVNIWVKCMVLVFGCVWGYFGVIRLCMVQQMLYIGKTSKGKTPHTWHFWNIKIPKLPYISSLKFIELLHFSKILGPDFFTETAVTPERKVEKSIPRWEINRHVEGSKWVRKTLWRHTRTPTSFSGKIICSFKG